MNSEDEIKMFETFDELDAKCKELTNGKFSLEDLVDTVENRTKTMRWRQAADHTLAIELKEHYNDHGQV